MSTKPTVTPEIEAGSDNVFEDLLLPHAEERLAKALLARAIRQVITARSWSQARAAKEIGLAQSDMSDIVRGKLGKFSLDRLESIILDLRMDIHIRVSPTPADERRGHVSVELVLAE